MGMYSSFSNEDLEILDFEGLKDEDDEKPIGDCVCFTSIPLNKLFDCEDDDSY